jgi:hypothetical protein
MGKIIVVRDGQTFEGGTLGEGSEFDRMEVQAGGTAVGTTVLHGGDVTNRGTTINFQLDGGTEDVAEGGSTAKGTVVLGHSKLEVFAFATSTGTSVGDGSKEVVFDAGVSNDATVRIGGTQEEFDRGQSNNATVFGREVVDGGGVSFLTNLVGGDEVVENNGVAISTTVTSNGKMFVHTGGRVEIGLTLVKGTAEIHGSMTSGTMTFAGPGGNLKLYNLPDFAAVIAGFGRGDLIDLGDFGFSSRTTASFSSGTLTVTDGNQHASLSLSGPYSTSNFALASDGAHGTLITFA